MILRPHKAEPELGRPRDMQGRNQDLRGGMLDIQAETESTQGIQNVRGIWGA